MAITRLGQFGVGLDAYGPFQAKIGKGSGQFTRLGQFGVGLSKYGVFLAKEAAEPAPEEQEFVGFPAISPEVIEGDGYGILPELFGHGVGVCGVIGTGLGQLPGLSGAARGDVAIVGRGVVLVASLRGDAVADHGQQGGAVVTLKALGGKASGNIGVEGVGSGEVILGIKGMAIGQHEDDDAAIIALLLAA